MGTRGSNRSSSAFGEETGVKSEVVKSSSRPTRAGEPSDNDPRLQSCPKCLLTDGAVSWEGRRGKKDSQHPLQETAGACEEWEWTSDHSRGLRQGGSHALASLPSHQAWERNPNPQPPASQCKLQRPLGRGCSAPTSYSPLSKRSRGLRTVPQEGPAAHIPEQHPGPRGCICRGWSTDDCFGF